MTQKITDKYWIIRSPSDQGTIVAKFDGETVIPDAIADYDSFAIQSVSDKSALTSKAVDQSGLTQDELDLLSQVYPVEQS